MAKNAPRLTIFSFFACFLLLSAVYPAFGGGSREADLSAADQLIAEKEYDRAIAVLTDFARRNPDQFDQAQARLNQIYLIREEFNKTADKLIQALLDGADDEEVVALIDKLRAIENENSPILVDFLARIHEIAIFNISRNQLRRALENGRQMLDRGNFEGALQAYAAGFSIMRDEFYSANFGTTVHNQTRQETERINAVISGFRAVSSQLESVTTELSRAVSSGQHTRVGEIMTRLTPAMDRFIAEKQIVYSSLAVFENHLRNLQRANPAMGDRNHLAFVIRVIYGRNEADIQEGILGVFDGFWNKSAGACLSTIAQYYENTNNAGLTSFNRRDFNNAVNTLSGIAAYTDVIPVFFDKHRQLTRVTTAQTVTFNGAVIPRDGLTEFLKLTSLNESSSALRQVAVIPGREQYDTNTLVNLRNRRITAQEALVIEQRTRDILASQQNEIQSIKERAVHADIQISEHVNFPYIKNAVSAIDNVINNVNTEVQQSALRYYNITHADIDSNLIVIKDHLEKAKKHMEGSDPSPSMALQELNPMLAMTDEDIDRANTLLTQLRGESPGITSNSEIRNLSNRYQASINELTNIRNQGQALADSAGSRAGQAEALRIEGERLFAEAQAAFQRRNFETAVQRLESATQRIDESLALQDSPATREFRNTQIIRLGQQILMAQNESVITEVRNLVNTARDLYFAGNFQRAEENLLRAQNRWRILDPINENSEVVLWLGMVHRAMSASSARVVPPTAPLYPEISQMLNQARRNYEEGIRLINAGQRTDGIAKFDEARVLTREVKLMFPVNQEAGILELRMEQFTDPGIFNAQFEQRLQTARAGTQRGSLEAYGDLLNLAEINPNYRGIRNIITQAEIDMGIRPPPPDPAAVARSRELTAMANRILEQRLTSQYESALVQINEAIALNPLNTEAPRIKDRLLNMSNYNEPSNFVLNNEDEALYQQAVRDHTAGNNLVAYATIERILQNPQNRNVTKVIELQQRLRRVLGL